ncbi:MAG: 30S ribosomal protein S6 [Rhizobiales bacterium]|nr:30S ribosomal protein S6 [Hyphomicrobiales bacterium]
MPLYEHVFLARQDVSNQQVETMTKEFQAIIEGGGGKVAKTEHWGVKSLAYKIKKNRKAHYTLLNIEAPHAAVAEMERQMSLNSDVLRFITLKVDKLESEPSAMMRKSDRDDRRGPRGDRGDRGDRGERRGGRDDRGPRGPRGDRGPERSGERGAERSGERRFEPRRRDESEVTE